MLCIMFQISRIVISQKDISFSDQCDPECGLRSTNFANIVELYASKLYTTCIMFQALNLLILNTMFISFTTKGHCDLKC